MTGWILCAPRWGDKERDKEMKWMTLCFPGNTAETDKWNLITVDKQLVLNPISSAQEAKEKNIKALVDPSVKIYQPPGFVKIEMQYEEGKLLVVNLDRDVPEREANELFAKYGELVNLKLCKDYENGKRNGKAWIHYKTSK